MGQLKVPPPLTTPGTMDCATQSKQKDNNEK
jgi:hypothetical protein